MMMMMMMSVPMIRVVSMRVSDPPIGATQCSAHNFCIVLILVVNVVIFTIISIIANFNIIIITM